MLLKLAYAFVSNFTRNRPVWGSSGQFSGFWGSALPVVFCLFCCFLLFSGSVLAFSWLVWLILMPFWVSFVFLWWFLLFCYFLSCISFRLSLFFFVLVVSLFLIFALGANLENLREFLSTIGPGPHVDKNSLKFSMWTQDNNKMHRFGRP